MEGDAGAQLFSTLALMFGGALLAGCAPFFIRVREAHLQTVAALGAGLLIGSALAVIVPEGFHAFAHVSAMVGVTVGGSQGMRGTAGLVCRATLKLAGSDLEGSARQAFELLAALLSVLQSPTPEQVHNSHNLSSRTNALTLLAALSLGYLSLKVPPHAPTCINPQAAAHAHSGAHAGSHEDDHAHGHAHDHDEHSSHSMHSSAAAGGHSHAHEEGSLPEGLAGLVLVCGFLAMMLLDQLQHAAGGSCGPPGHSHGHSGHGHGHSHGGDEGSDKVKDKAKGGGKGAGDCAAAAAAAGGSGKTGQEGGGGKAEAPACTGKAKGAWQAAGR